MKEKIKKIKSKTDFDLIKWKTELIDFAKERDWEQFHTLKNLSMALTIECSELMEIFQWLNESQIKKILNNKIEREKIEDEVSDIMVYLIRIITIAKIDINTAMKRKMLKNAKKYPVNKSRGLAKKYTDL